MPDDRKVLPLKEAYSYAASHGFDKEVSEIRDMEI